MGNRATVCFCILISSGVAAADDEVIDPLAPEGPPSTVTPINTTSRIPGVTGVERDYGLWGGGVRLTGMSGIGALPGVNVGGEVAVHIRRDELFGELAMGHWQPQETFIVVETPERVELALDVWTARGGWASRNMPLRGWLLAEVGELAGPKGMSGALPRMVMMGVPDERRWFAVGGGFGVAWPMSDNVRLFGAVELAIPVHRRELMMSDRVKPFEPDIAAARSSLGLEVGWR